MFIPREHFQLLQHIYGALSFHLVYTFEQSLLAYVWPLLSCKVNSMLPPGEDNEIHCLQLLVLEILFPFRHSILSTP